MAELFANSLATTLTAAITNVQTTVAVAAASSFPPTGNFRIQIDTELLLVTAVAGLTLTVTRGAESSAAVAHNNGAVVAHVLTAGALAGLKTNAIANAAWLTARNAANTADVNIARVSASGQVEVASGAVLTTYVPLATSLTSASWTTAAHSTDATPQALNLATVFGLPANVKAVAMRVDINDSASATTAYCSLALGPGSASYNQSVIWIEGMPNNSIHISMMVLNTNGNSGVYYKCVASGTLTMDVTIKINGYWI